MSLCLNSLFCMVGGWGGGFSGKLECHFLGIRDLNDGRATTIDTSNILDGFLDFDIINVSSFGSDGASYNTGR